MNRVCTKCNKNKPLTEFYEQERNKTRKDGSAHRWTSIMGHCKKCHYAINRMNAHKYADYYKEYRKNNKEKISVRTRAYYEKNMQNWWGMAGELVKLECSDCGYSGSSSALDFHHKDPKEKEVSIHKIMGGGEKPNDINIARFKKELAKCIVLCANCHREAHAKYNWLEKITPKITDALKK